MDEQDIIVSFCIPVYNQSDLVKRCIESITQSDRQDIEIVINDDCSTEDIEKIVKECNDSRIRYFRNPENLGHDLNILSAFKNARGRYAFLLRTRDYIIKDNISCLIESIIKHPNCNYFLSSCLDEEGNIRYKYEDKLYSGYDQTIEANYSLIVHPSGSCYSIMDLDLDRLISFVKENVEGKYGFIVHSLIRQELALKGCFLTINKPLWVYAYTEHQTDIAQNKTSNGMSVYDSSFTYNRFLYELKWMKCSAPNNLCGELFVKIFSAYLYSVTWGYYVKNKNRNLQKHYGYKENPFSVNKERKEFYKFAITNYVSSFGVEPDETTMKKIASILRRNKYVSWLPAQLRRFGGNTYLYKKLGYIFR